MAVIFGLPNWVWIAIAAAGVAGCVVILRALQRVFASLDELADSLELSKRMLSSALEVTREESEKAKAGLARLGGSEEAGPEESWRDW